MVVADAVGRPAALAVIFTAGRQVMVLATAADGRVTELSTILRIDTPQEVAYYQHGGILPYVLRQLMQSGARAGRASRT